MMMISKKQNANFIALFKFANKIELDEKIPTTSAFIPEKQFKDLFHYAVDKLHDSLVIDATKGNLFFKKLKTY